MKTKLFIGLLSCGLMLNVACDTGGDDPVEQARDINQDRDHVENDDSKVLTDAASYSMWNMEMSRIAEERAVTPEVKELARELSQEHSDVKQNIEGIAQRKQIALPQALSDDHRDKIDNVTDNTGLDFDKEFVDEVISSHRDKIDDFESLSRDSEDPEIREFAINTLPKLRMQLEKAERVENQLQQRDDGQADGGMFDGDDNRNQDQEYQEQDQRRTQRGDDI
jgi:putative membrane protein